MKTSLKRISFVLIIMIMGLCTVSCSQVRKTTGLITEASETGREQIGEVIEQTVAHSLGTSEQVAPDAATDIAPLAFAPPDGTVYIQKTKIERIVDAGAMAQVTTSFEAEIKITVKRSDNVYLLIHEPISYTSYKDGEILANPMLDEMKKVTLIYRISPAGRLIDVKGFDEVEQRILSLFPPDAARLFFQYINRKKLTRAEQVEWQNRVTNFVGKKIKVGDAWVDIENYVFPIMNTAFGYYAAGTVVETKPCGDTNCLVIENTFSTDRARLKKILGPIADVVPVPATGQVDVKNKAALSISGHARRVIDPASLLYHEESSKIIIETTLNVPGEGTVYYSEVLAVDTEYSYLPSVE
jgi:hypothetical protein